MRAVDDRILLALNTPIETANAKSEITEEETCAFFFRKLHDTSRERRQFIKDCIGTQTQFVRKLDEKANANPTDKTLATLQNAAVRKVWLRHSIQDARDILIRNVSQFLPFSFEHSKCNNWQKIRVKRTHSLRLRKSVRLIFLVRVHHRCKNHSQSIRVH